MRDDGRGSGVIAVILNPRAARGKALGLLPFVVGTLRDLGVNHRVHVSTSPTDAREAARRFADDGAARVLAVGGDGLINETVNGLLLAERLAVLGVVPASRGSDFARSIGAPRNLRDAITHAINAAPRRIDAGLARFDDGAERAFVNIGGVGLDAVVADRANRSRVPGSTLPYLAAIAATLVGFHNLDVVIESDSCHREAKVCAVLVANGRYFGGGMKIVPAADLADGRLDLAILGELGKADLLRTLPKVFWGGHVGHPKFRHDPVREVHVSSASSALVELDGEVVGRTPVSFRILPNALLVAG